MGRKSALRTRIADSDVVEFMSEFARYLVESGITSARFASIMRVAFFRAASIEARFQNQRLNRSAVAAMTGLTRAQVREFAKETTLVPTLKRGRIDKIIDGWVSDPLFTTAEYAPRRLSIGRKGAAFNALVEKYGGDVPARSVLREMLRTECASVDGKYIVLTLKARRTRGQARLKYLSRCLAKLLHETDSKSKSLYPLRISNAELVYPATSAKGRILMQKRYDKSLSAFVAELQAAGIAASIESPPSSAQKGWKTRTRIVLVSEELHHGNTKSDSHN